MGLRKNLVKTNVIIVYLSVCVFILNLQYSDNERETLFVFFTKDILHIYTLFCFFNFLFPILFFIETWFLKCKRNRKQAILLILQGGGVVVITAFTIWLFKFSLKWRFNSVDFSSQALVYIYIYLYHLFIYGFWSILLGAKNVRNNRLIAWVLD